MSQQTPQQPARTFRARGGLSLSVWENKITDGDRTLVQHSFRLQKRYRDKAGQWQTSSSYFERDIPKIMRLLERAYDFVVISEDDTSDPTFDPNAIDP